MKPTRAIPDITDIRVAINEYGHNIVVNSDGLLFGCDHARSENTKTFWENTEAQKANHQTFVWEIDMRELWVCYGHNSDGY